MKIWKTIKQVDSIRKIIPGLMVLATRQPRYLPDIQWSSNSWTHNLFRIYESIFWRRYGIKAEMASFVTRHKDKFTVVYKCHSFESVFALAEQMLRTYFKKWELVEVRLPQLAFIDGLMMKSPFMFAIAYDDDTFSATHQQNNSFSHTCTGSNRYLVLCTEVHRSPDYHLNGITYNSVAMTSQITNTGSPDNRLWDLVAPATGSNTVAISGSNADTWHEDCAVSFTGVKQTGQPDATAVIAALGNAQTSGSWNITTIADNCWCITDLSGANGVTLTATAGTWVGTNPGSVQFGQQIFYAGPKTPAGSLTTSFTCASSNFPTDFVVMSFAPVVVTSTGNFFLVF